MDSLRGQTDIEGDDIDDFGAIEAPPMFQSQERRMHVRAYNYWVSLLGNRTLPSIEDLNPEETSDFSANSVLLDFSMGMENPAILYLGSALRDECGITGHIERVADVPARSLLTRLTDHYLQIIANAAPVGFEAEFINQRDTSIRYRGILMPFSSDDETIDFIYGVINWKEAASDSMLEQLGAEMEAALASPPMPSAAAIWSDGPSVTADFADEDEKAEEYLDDLVELTDLDDIGDDRTEAKESTPAFADAAADDGDFGFDEDPVAAALSGLEDMFAPPQAEQAVAASDDSGLDEIDGLDALGSLDDLLAMPGDAMASAAPLEAEPQALDELDLGAFLMPGDAPESAPVVAMQEPEAAAADADGDDFGLNLDDLLAELSPETQAAAEEPVAVQDEEVLEELPDVDDILAGMDFEMPGSDEPVAEEPVAEHDAGEECAEPASEMDLDDLLGAMDLDDDLPEMVAPLAAALPAVVEADLADLLAEARTSAAEVRECDARSRAALYRAIGHAHDFALSAQGSPADYAEMLEDAGITVQERSPMTAVIKLVFGAEYDKTRIAEYALALDHANATGLSRGELGQLLASYKGGLKGLVQEMRNARKGDDAAASVPRPLRRLERAVRKLQGAKAADMAALPFGELGIAVVVARREEDGSITLLSGVGLDDKAAQKVMIAASNNVRKK